MLKKFQYKSPLAAIIFTILFGPINGMLYLNNGKLAIKYLMSISLIIISPLIVAHYSSWYFHPIMLIKVLLIALEIIGIFHCYRIAKKGITTPPKWFSHWYIILLQFPILIIFRLELFTPYSITSHSMDPNFNLGDYFFAEVQAYKLSSPKRGDVIIFNISKKSSPTYIKRIIGLPGEHLQLKQGIVYINDIPLQMHKTKNYSSNQEYIETLSKDKEIGIIITDPQGYLENTKIYDIPPDHYFVLGDNRDHSLDSRTETVGYININNIIGKTSPVFWNMETHKFSYKTVN